MDDGSGSDYQSSPDRTAHKAESDGGRRTPDTTPTRRRKLGGSSGHSGGSLSLDSVHSMREGKGIALGLAKHGADIVGCDINDEALAQVARKGAPAALGRVRAEVLDEGRCVQTLHVGSYDDEGPVLAQMHDRFIPEAGLRMTGRHHEIYLSDPRRVAPERLRTILRQPVEPAQPGT